MPAAPSSELAHADATSPPTRNSMPSIASIVGISKDKGYRRDWRNEIDEINP
jgi:hypothetical protein